MRRPSKKLAFTLNGRPLRVELPPHATALEALRGLGCAGVLPGCGAGECGSCTIVLDGDPTLTCLLLAAELDGRDVRTIECANDERIERLREAFLDAGAVQCGFCSPGMIMAASGLRPEAGPREIRRALAGNVCRCTGYAAIVRAIETALQGGEE